MDPPFELAMAGLMAVMIAVQLYTGRLHLDRAPEAYRHASRSTDPGRYWAFIVGTTIVVIAMTAEALFHLLR